LRKMDDRTCVQDFAPSKQLDEGKPHLAVTCTSHEYSRARESPTRIPQPTPPYSRATDKLPSRCSCHVRLFRPAARRSTPDISQHKISSRRRRFKKAKHKPHSTCNCSSQPAQRSGYRRMWWSGQRKCSKWPMKKVLYKRWRH
jgi:hypothetical protein